MTTIIKTKGDSYVCLRSEIEKPDEGNYYPGRLGEIKYDSDFRIWEKSFKEYPIRKEDEEKFMTFFTEISYNSEYLIHDLSQGIEIDSDLVRIEEFFIEKTPYELERDYKANWGSIGYKETGFKSLGMYAVLVQPKEVLKIKDTGESKRTISWKSEYNNEKEVVSEDDKLLNDFSNYCLINGFFAFKDSNQISRIVTDYLTRKNK